MTLHYIIYKTQGRSGEVQRMKAGPPAPQMYFLYLLCLGSTSCCLELFLTIRSGLNVQQCHFLLLPRLVFAFRIRFTMGR